MKKLAFLFFVLGCVVVSCTTSPKELKVTVENTQDFDRQGDIVEILLTDIKGKVELKENQSYAVLNSKGADVAYQITTDGKLLFQSNLKAKETATFTITTKDGAAPQFEAKTYARFIQERKDDFAWENDRVAFRIYGPALIETDGPSNGLDVWYKRTNALVIDKWYKDDLAGVASYHEDHGEGLDDYKVGRSLGAGAMAPYVNDKLWLNENFVSQELIDNGPLRTTFKLTYKSVDVDGKSYAESRTFSIDAGSQLTKITEDYSGVEGSMPVAAGFVKRENDSIITSVENNYLVYAEPVSEKVGNVYLGLVFPEGFEKSVVDTYAVDNAKTKKQDSYSHVLGVATYKANTPLTYYTGYGWSKFGFPTVADFEKYMDNFSKGLKNPLIVKF